MSSLSSYSLSFSTDSSFTFLTALYSALFLDMPFSSIVLSILSVFSATASDVISGCSEDVSSDSIIFSASDNTLPTRSLSFLWLVSVDRFHTNVYLFDADSILVPSTYWTFNDTNPSLCRSSTIWVNSPSNTPLRRLPLKLLMVLKSGRFMPDSHMYTTFSLSIRSMRRPE